MTVKTGTLYIVATPIGNLQDITLRAIEILKKVDLIAAEDLRVSKKLLQHFGIKTKSISLHSHNEEQRTGLLIEKILSGKNIALISDAGTPLISDPGFRLVQNAHRKNITIMPIPGACAAIAALSAAGFPCAIFAFEGFLPSKKMQRRKKLFALENEARTLIFYEAPHRIIASLCDMAEIFGSDRQIVFAREITKFFETIKSGSLAEIIEWIQKDQSQQKGEMVILVQSKNNDSQDANIIDSEATRILKILSQDLPKSQAIRLTAKLMGKAARKKNIYKMALQDNKLSHSYE